MKAILIILFFALFACNTATQNNKDTDSAVTKNDSIKTDKDTVTMSNKELEDSVIYISFPRDSTWVTVNGKMKGINHPITVYIPVKQGKQLTATIVPEDSVANIRINQIFTPNQKADGPFGRELKRTLNQQGTYKLIIAENMMQGDEWKGNFKLTIKVE